MSTIQYIEKAIQMFREDVAKGGDIAFLVKRLQAMVSLAAAELEDDKDTANTAA